MLKLHLVTYFLFLVNIFVFAQERTFVIKDGLTGEKVTNAKVKLNNKLLRDNKGVYSYIPEANSKLIIKCDGYITLKKLFSNVIPKEIYLDPKTYQLEEVAAISTTEQKKLSKVAVKLSSESIMEEAGKDLANILSAANGVVAMKSGAGISKPAIHGMSGSRVLVLNNGINVESQQWGDEHGIEIDPLLANEIEVIKGASGLRYGMGGLSGVILVKPKSIFSYTKAFSGDFFSGFEINSKKIISAINLGGKLKKIPVFWQVQGSYINSGDYRTAEYVVNNSGNENKSITAQLGWRNKATKVTGYTSFLQQNIGTFYGVRIGNEGDLINTIEHGVPLRVYPWSREIDAPKQEVLHQLYKLEVNHKWSKSWQSNLIFGYQKNHRQEYEVRRLDYTKVPALDLQLSSKVFDFYTIYKNHNWKITSGIYAKYRNNYSIPGTGVVPVIPNFVNQGWAGYAIAQYKRQKLNLELGTRFEYQYLNALGKYITTQEYGGKHYFNALNISLNGGYALNEDLRFTMDFGIAQRIPSVYELYSKGVSHGKPFYVEGNNQLKEEKSYKWISALNFKNKNWEATLSAYINPVNNFIYTKYSGMGIQQWAGYFAIFDFTQSNALFKGIDIDTSYSPVESFKIYTKYSSVIAKNREDGTYLPQIPADRWMSGLSYEFPDFVQNMKNRIKINHTYVAKAHRYSPNYDLIKYTPEAYNLFDLTLDSKITLKKATLHFYIGVENILNELYKDYTDNFRYFTHLPGRNIFIKTAIKF